MADSKIMVPVKKVKVRIASCNDVLEAVDTYGGDLVRRYAARRPSATFAASGAHPMEETLQMLRQDLFEARELMVDTDRVYRGYQASVQAVRSRRENLRGELRTALIDVRDVAIGLFGVDASHQLGFARQTPEDDTGVLEQAKNLVLRLEDPQVIAPKPRYEGFAADKAGISSGLGPRVEDLEGCVADLGHERRGLEKALAIRDEALDEFNEVFLQVARAIEALFRLVGLGKIADRIRPSAHRPGLTSKVLFRDGDPDGADDEPAGDTPDEEPSEDDASDDDTPPGVPSPTPSDEGDTPTEA